MKYLLRLIERFLLRISSHFVNFEARKMLFTSKWGRILPGIQCYQNKCSNYGTLSYTTALFEKNGIFNNTPICRPTMHCFSLKDLLQYCSST